MALSIMLGVAMAATLFVLFAGVLTFAIGGKFNREYSTRLMAARVMLQGVALAVFAVAAALAAG